MFSFSDKRCIPDSPWTDIRNSVEIHPICMQGFPYGGPRGRGPPIEVSGPPMFGPPIIPILKIWGGWRGHGGAGEAMEGPPVFHTNT